MELNQLPQPAQSQQSTVADLKRSRMNEAIRRKRMTRVFWGAGIIAAMVLLIGMGVWVSKRRGQNLPGVSYPDQGRDHVSLDSAHEYNSNPPTSGWHYANPADWGVYDKELPDKILIHNIEHGGIWISYKPGIPEDVRKKLENFHHEWGRKIIVTPRAANDTDIAVAAWAHLDTMSASEYSEDRITKFIKAYRNRGPEFVP